ncbi:peroxisomal membrane protein pex14 [Coemansia asiatica]|uniref:Peroxisomal membrane protein PEX14 n=1 Tax=Coemansia asiatica TaxID=1052880 RepID=A0A9W8CKH3_9FUNG|nr:peroxisomal membrane protein pex14 [Coemansia asiatica]KAJ2888423.1 peroxisomal membrane protein pex14 [Coemansia asiatica]
MSAEAASSSASASAPVPALREDIIESAVRFLSDPKVQSSTLAKKISFLETKGLTNAEIEDALARAKSGQQGIDSAAQQPQQTGTVVPASTAPAGYGYAQPMAPPTPPPRPHLDWKDYFIAAVVAGGLGYGLYMFAKKYIKPLLMARDDNERLEQEKKILIEQNEFTRKQLETLTDSTTRILETISQQSQKTSEAIEGMTAVMEKISARELESNSSSRQLLITIEDLQREITAFSSKAAKSGDSSVADIQSDIRSLRSLLLSRRVPAPSSSPAPRAATPSAPASASAITSNAASTGLSEQPSATDSADSADAAKSAEYVADSSPAASISPIPTPTIPAWQLAMTNGARDKGKQAESASD